MYCRLPIEVKVLARGVYKELLALGNESFEYLFEVVVNSFDSVLAVNTQSVAESRDLLNHLLAGVFVAGLLNKSLHSFVNLVPTDESACNYLFGRTDLSDVLLVGSVDSFELADLLFEGLHFVL